MFTLLAHYRTKPSHSLLERALLGNIGYESEPSIWIMFISPQPKIKAALNQPPLNLPKLGGGKPCMFPCEHVRLCLSIPFRSHCIIRAPPRPVLLRLYCELITVTTKGQSVGVWGSGARRPGVFMLNYTSSPSSALHMSSAGRCVLWTAHGEGLSRAGIVHG